MYLHGRHAHHAWLLLGWDPHLLGGLGCSLSRGRLSGHGRVSGRGLLVSPGSGRFAHAAAPWRLVGRVWRVRLAVFVAQDAGAVLKMGDQYYETVQLRPHIIFRLDSTSSRNDFSVFAVFASDILLKF